MGVGLQEVLKFMESKAAYFLSSVQQNYDMSGNMVADFNVFMHKKYPLEVVVNMTAGVVSIRDARSEIIPFSKTLVDHPEAFKSQLQEVEQLIANGIANGLNKVKNIK